MLNSFYTLPLSFSHHVMLSKIRIAEEYLYRLTRELNKPDDRRQIQVFKKPNLHGNTIRIQRLYFDNHLSTLANRFTATVLLYILV